MPKEQEFSNFVPYWKAKPRPQVVEEIASYSLETKRIPDPYYFLINPDGKLVSPQTGKLVEESIEKESYLGQLESAAFNRIQEWDKDKNKGLSFWISPPHPQRSRFTKMVVSEITTEENQKRLFNRALLLNLNSDEAVALGKELSLKSTKEALFESSENLRSQPVFIDPENLDWLSFLAMRVNDGQIWEKIKNGEDIEIKNEAVQKSGIIYEEIFGKNYPKGYDDERLRNANQKARELELFGKFGASCPPPAPVQQQTKTGFDLLYGIAEKSFPCPECHKPIPSGRGVTTCPHCGVTKEEVGSKCD